MAAIETVRVINETTKTGYMTINKEDLTNRHKIWEEKPEPQKAKRETKKNETE